MTGYATKGIWGHWEPDFFDSTELPRDPDQARRWQDANRSWWESHPMRYDWTDSIDGVEEFSRDYFAEIDRRFFSKVRSYMPWKSIPFDSLIDFEGLARKDVLEVGVGSGCHAQLLASHAGSLTGIDITQYAVQSTVKRMEALGLQASVERMDAENMRFPDDSFDFVWSWGVVHHSANTLNILREICRVLRPGGVATLMVYHRSLWGFYMLGAIRGLLQGSLLRSRSINREVQRYTDGAIARYYTEGEWRALVSELFHVRSVRVLGAKRELIPLPAGRMKDLLDRAVPDSLGRLLNNRLRQGSFLVSTLEKPR